MIPSNLCCSYLIGYLPLPVKLPAQDCSVFSAFLKECPYKSPYSQAAIGPLFWADADGSPQPTPPPAFSGPRTELAKWCGTSACH
jgi:hypothetical protein